MISKTMVKSRLVGKTNPIVAEAIRLALKNKNWLDYAKLFSTSSRRYSSINLSEIDKKTTAGDTVLIPGKVLSQGNITKKLRICAFSISDTAKEKLRSTKSEYVSIVEEINKNSKAEGIKIIR